MYKCHTVTVRPEICVKMFIFKVDVQSDHLETKCSCVKVSQGKSVTVDVSSGSKCHSGRNVGGRNVKASRTKGVSLRATGSRGGRILSQRGGFQVSEQGEQGE